jgi:diguanylate cyclase (GGDEF)-like protein
VQDDGTQQVPVPVEATPRRAANPTILVYDGDEIGALHGLQQDETTFGRTGDCDVVLADDQVSRRHAMVRKVGRDQFELVDLDSTNGTLLNGKGIQRAVLRDGDKIAVGGHTLKFAYLDQQDLAYQARIAEMIHVDDLTGLLTKRSLFRAMDKELQRASRYGRPLSVLMMDLDHFKLVNDTHGHLVGSHCLAQVGRLIRETTRTVDVNGRYGGEEFVSFLPETVGDEALGVARRIREALASRTFTYNGTSYGVTISIGVSVFPEHGRTVEALVHAADLALYQAKSQGRNRCTLHEPAMAGRR